MDCPACGHAPVVVEGFIAYAPLLSRVGGGFDAARFSDLARLEEANFWFRCRNKLILWAIRKYCPSFHSFLEIGCGTGFVISGIAKSFPDTTLYGSEIFTAGLEFASARLPSANLMQMDARNIPFYNEFDAIGAFDVLEHIEEDELVLAQLHSALNPDGVMLLTVPQHEWLWSATDERACHVRRYEAANFQRKIKSAGFEIVRSTSFVSILLPAMMVSRFFKRRGADGVDARAELAISPFLNLLFLCLLSIELVCVKIGLDFPFGGSRLVVAKKIR
jgi:SAM-dependent methyltransferase